MITFTNICTEKNIDVVAVVAYLNPPKTDAGEVWTREVENIA